MILKENSCLIYCGSIIKSQIRKIWLVKNLWIFIALEVTSQKSYLDENNLKFCANFGPE